MSEKLARLRALLDAPQFHRMHDPKAIHVDAAWFHEITSLGRTAIPAPTLPTDGNPEPAANPEE